MAAAESEWMDTRHLQTTAFGTVDHELGGRPPMWRFWRALPPADGLGMLPFPGGFALFDGERPAVRRPAPRVGEHNAEIWGQAGVDPDELARLRAVGAV